MRAQLLSEILSLAFARGSPTPSRLIRGAYAGRCSAAIGPGHHGLILVVNGSFQDPEFGRILPQFSWPLSRRLVALGVRWPTSAIGVAADMSVT